jgi:pimeloyl-ACP methyl ester carboxylesterase
MTRDRDGVVGVAAGVPFLAVAPATRRDGSAPVVLAWHMLDPPRTEAAFAAALPLAGLDAWRIYLGLPLNGSRLPPGGVEELTRLANEDAVMNLHGPIASQAAAEVEPALAELRERLELGDGPIGVLGGSLGAAVAQLVLVEGDLEIEAAVLVSPLVRLRSVVDALGRRFGVTYPWSERSLDVARRLDFVARADEIAESSRPAVLLVVGEDDDPAGFHEPATALQAALAHRYGGDAQARLVRIPGMEHAVAEEPGMKPAPQTAHAALVDREAVRWLRDNLEVR